MATRVVGLDIGTYAVRAVELVVGGRPPVLQRFPQVTLPPASVRAGEVVDVGAVSPGIRRLWSDAGFRSRRVVLGVANQRVIIRQAELPAMSEQDLQQALQFEVQELIPIPVEDAILDFQVLDESVSDQGEPRMRILLAAAQRDMVRTHLAAAEGARLDASAVDIVPFALVRALTSPTTTAFDGDGNAEAIICIGGGVTNVVVHEQGAPRFVRVLLVGGDDVTEAIATTLDVDLDTAEFLKRRADTTSPDAMVAEAGRVVGDRLGPLAEEIRGSLDYYLAQSQSAPIGRTLVTGGGSRMPGLMERLQSQLGGRVEPARPLDNLKIGQVRLSQAELADLEPLLTVPVGLALAGEPLRGVRRISLLPREVAVVREQRRQVTGIAAAVALLAVVLVLLWVARASQVTEQRERAERAEEETAQLQRQAAELQDVTALQADLSQRQAQVATVLANDVAWTRLFQEVATVIPSDVWLTAFTGQKAPGGTVNFTAKGFDQTSTARWLLRVGELKSLSGLWVPNSTKQGEGAAVTVNFTSQANITPEARSDRLQRFSDGPR